MSALRVVAVPQVDGVMRYLAVSAADYAWIQREPGMVDHVPVLACLDTLRGGRAEWGGMGADTAEGRAAITAYRRGDDDMAAQDARCEEHPWHEDGYCQECEVQS
jgi:hypothetical protein